MKSLLHSLADSDSVLLMYLFDELPEEDRAEVESMLVTDHGLSTRLEELRAAYEHTTQLLVQCDAASKTQARSVNVARRNAVRLLGQWQVQKTIDQPAPREVSAVRKYVLYPAMGLAAMMLIGLILWGMFGTAPQPPTLTSPIVELVPDEERIQLAELQRSLLAEASEEPVFYPAVDVAAEEMLVRSLDPSDELFRDVLRNRFLRDAESQIAYIAQMSEDPDF